MKGLIDVKPKVKRIYQAMQYTDDSWTIVEKENFNNEYVITDDIEELIYIHKDMEDFEFLGTKSAEITVQIKDK